MSERIKDWFDEEHDWILMGLNAILYGMLLLAFAGLAAMVVGSGYGLALVYVASPILGGFIGYSIVKWQRRRPKPEATPAEEETAKIGEFCSDCGKAYTVHQAQDGYDTATGNPNWKYVVGCPDTNPTKHTKEYERYLLAPPSSMTFGYISYGPKNRYAWPDCHNRAAVSFMPATVLASGYAHLHGTSIDPHCEGCIQDLMNMGSITAEDADRLRLTA